MTRQQALAKARKLFGAKAGIRAGDAISSPERRDACRAEAAQLDAPIAELDARIAALLESSGINALNRERRELQKVRERARWDATYQRFSIGATFAGIAFEIKGQGDTWEQAFQNADDRRKDGL